MLHIYLKKTLRTKKIKKEKKYKKMLLNARAFTLVDMLSLDIYRWNVNIMRDTESGDNGFLFRFTGNLC